MEQIVKAIKDLTGSRVFTMNIKTEREVDNILIKCKQKQYTNDFFLIPKTTKNENKIYFGVHDYMLCCGIHTLLFSELTIANFDTIKSKLNVSCCVCLSNPTEVSTHILSCVVCSCKLCEECAIKLVQRTNNVLSAMCPVCRQSFV